MSEALILFIKNPESGRCKTRLAKTIGEQKALLVYKKLLEHTRATALEINGHHYLFYDKFIDSSDNWPKERFDKRLQAPGDLGMRMSSAFRALLQDNDRAVIIGSDCPRINPRHILDAFQVLREKDLVIGPSFDGGYYLLGMRAHHDWLFENMPWSTDKVLDTTLSRIDDHKLSYSLLEKLHDLDDESDLALFPDFMP